MSRRAPIAPADNASGVNAPFACGSLTAGTNAVGAAGADGAGRNGGRSVRAAGLEARVRQWTTVCTRTTETVRVTVAMATRCSVTTRGFAARDFHNGWACRVTGAAAAPGGAGGTTPTGARGGGLRRRRRRHDRRLRRHDGLCRRLRRLGHAGYERRGVDLCCLCDVARVARACDADVDDDVAAGAVRDRLRGEGRRGDALAV